MASQIAGRCTPQGAPPTIESPPFLIAVKGDSLADVAVLEKVSFVMREGKVYKDARERQ